MWLVFFGGFRGTHEQEHHLHESPAAMTIPLIILAILALVGGFVQLPEAFGGKEYFNEFLSPVVPAMSHEGSSVATTEYYMLTGTVIGLAVIYFLTRKNLRLVCLKAFTPV